MKFISGKLSVVGRLGSDNNALKVMETASSSGSSAVRHQNQAFRNIMNPHKIQQIL